MPQVATRRKLTYEDYAQIPDDGLRHEILDGEHHVSPAARTRHQIVVLELATRLKGHVERHDLGIVLIAPFDAVLSDHDVVQPDVLFLSQKRMGRLTEASLQGAPDLAIEVLSPSSRRYDTQLKFRRYEALGVQEYWIVEPEAETVAVHRCIAGVQPPRYAAIELGEGVVTSPLFPGLRIGVAAIFAKLPRLE